MRHLPQPWAPPAEGADECQLRENVRLFWNALLACLLVDLVYLGIGTFGGLANPSHALVVVASLAAPLGALYLAHALPYPAMSRLPPPSPSDHNEHNDDKEPTAKVKAKSR